MNFHRRLESPDQASKSEYIGFWLYGISGDHRNSLYPERLSHCLMFKSSGKFISLLEKSHLSRFHIFWIVCIRPIYFVLSILITTLSLSMSSASYFPFRRKALIVIQDELRAERPLRALALLRLAKWVPNFPFLSQALSNQNNRGRIFNIEIFLTLLFHESVACHS